jgi:hypothetical protein
MYLTKGQKLPIMRSTLWGVVFCLDLGPFVFFFSCLLVGCFFFSLYYDKFPYTPRKDTTLSHEMFPLEWPIPMFGPPLDSSFVLYYSLLWPMPMPLWALPIVGLTHHDHGKQACHHKKVANSQIISLPTMQGIPHFHKKRRQTKGIVHAPYYHSSSEINGKEHR